MLSLELVKTRLAVMSMEMRKNFIQAILTSLIEKSPDAKILRAVVKIVEEWVKNNSPMAANQVSSQRAVPRPGPPPQRDRDRQRERVSVCVSSTGFLAFLQKVLQQTFSPLLALTVFFLKMSFSHCLCRF